MSNQDDRLEQIIGGMNKKAQGVTWGLRNPFLGAFKKGYRCAEDGGKINDNPYGDQRTWFGGVTFARGFWKAWNSGFEAYNNNPPPEAGRSEQGGSDDWQNR